MSEVLGRRVIEDVATLKALADPIRMAILELAMAEPDRTWTAKEFSAVVGISPTKIYYHLNMLEQHQLLQIRDTRVVKGIIEKQYGAGQRDLTFHRRSDDDADGVRAVVATQLGQVRDEIDRGLAAGTMSASPDAPVNERILLSQGIAEIADKDIEAFRQELMELTRRFEKSSTSGGHRFAMMVAMHPVSQPR